MKPTLILLLLALVPTWCCGQSLSGTVFEDANYGGGAGRSLAASGAGGSARPGATVELYDAAGAFVAAAVTNSVGVYTLNPAPGTYTVRVVCSTVSSSRPLAPSFAREPLPVPTYNGTTDHVGGEAPQKVDAPLNTKAFPLDSLNTVRRVAQAQATVTVGNTPVTGVDFGFNFDTVVNTNSSGQGSLFQFSNNAHVLGGESSLAQAGFYANQIDLAVGAPVPAVALPAGIETSIFMISDGRAHPGLRAGLPNQLSAQGVAVIKISTNGVIGIDNPVILNGLTQTYNVGNTNDVLLGSGGTVGVDNLPLSRLNGPEVRIQNGTDTYQIITINKSPGGGILGFNIYGIGIPFIVNQGVGFSNSPDFLVAQNVMAPSASTFGNDDPGPGNRTNMFLLFFNNSPNSRITNNLLSFSQREGIMVSGYGLPFYSPNTVITNNELVGNALATTPEFNYLFQPFYPASIRLASPLITVTGNRISGGGNNAILVSDLATDCTVSNNTIEGNGVAGVFTSGVGSESTGLTFTRNVVRNNVGAGVLVRDAGAGTSARISENSIYGNGQVAGRETGQLGIDLLSTSDAPFTGTPPFVTFNDPGDPDVGGNNLLNYPVLESVTVSGGNLVLKGFAPPGALVEVFVAQPNTVGAPNATGNNFGQGKTFLFARTEGSGADADNTTGSYGPGPVNGFDQGQDNTNKFSFTIPLSSLSPAQQAALAGATRLTATATVGGVTSEFSGNAPLANPFGGYVFEDANYGGGAGRSRATLGAGAVGRAGARVELYDATGGFVDFATTDATGQYTFPATPGPSYVVRVVSSTISSARPGYVAGLLPVPTYNDSPNRVGGEYPARADAGPNTTSANLSTLLTPTTAAQCLAVVLPNPAGGDPVAPDFGFNFSTVVNTNPAGQGSLAQFIRNSNALTNAGLDQAPAAAGGVDPAAGVETSIFMIPDGQAHAGLRAFNATTSPGLGSQLTAQGGQQVAIISLVTAADALPAITDANTDLDATTQTRNIGNTNNATLGAGGTVGVGADGVAGTGDELTLTQLNGPEVQLSGTSAINIGLDLQGRAASVSGFAVVGFGSTGNLDGMAGIHVVADESRITRNVIGTSATSFTAPTPLSISDGVRVYGKNTLIANNLIGFNSGKGITVSFNATGGQMRGNELRSNGLANAIWDGIDVLSSRVTTVGNLLVNNTGQGFDSFLAPGLNTVSDNTCVGNGGGSATSLGETPGIRIYGSGNVISRNLVYDNHGAGLSVVSSADANLISQNSFYGNGNTTANNGSPARGQIGIDLLGPSDDPITGTTPYVTLNDGTLTPIFNAGNRFQDYPVLLTASRTANILTVSGYARPGVTIELFLAQANPAGNNAVGANFGQGKTYLSTAIEGSAADADASTGLSYSGPINGFNQGSDANANGFRFAITLTPAQLAQFTDCETLLTSTATINGATSEFSGNVRATQPVLKAGSIAADQTVCAGATPAALTSTAPATGGAGSYAYQWQISTDNGVTWTDISGATGAAYAPGPLSATTQFRRRVSSGACAPTTLTTTPVVVTVAPAVAAGSIGADQTVCAGATPAGLTSTTAATGGTGSYAYQWEQSTDNGATWTAIAGATGAGFTPSPVGATTQFRRQVLSGGCAGAPTNVATITVTPGLVAGSIAADQTVCAGATPAALTSTAPATGGAGSYAYQWQISTDNGVTWTDISGATGAAYAPGPLTQTTYFRRQVSSGTGSCATAVSGVVTVRVAPVLATSVSLSPPPVQCAGTALTLTATPTNAGANPTYRWLVNGAAVAVTGPVFSSTTLSNGDQVRVELTPTPGLCGAGPATATVAISQTLAPVPAVVVEVRPAGPVCPGEPLTFGVVRVTDAGPAPQYQWQVNGVDVAGATGPTFSSTTLRDGQTVTLRLRATTACGQLVGVGSNSLAARISPPVRVDAGPDQEIEAGQSVTLEGRADGPYPVVWTPAAGLTFPGNDRLRPVVAPLETTTYTLSAGAGGCAATDQATVRVRPTLRIPNAFTPNGDGRDDTWQIERIEAFPNTRVNIFNRWGNQIFSSENYGRANEWKGDINGKPAPVGTYYYVLVTKGPFGRSYSGPLTVLY